MRGKINEDGVLQIERAGKWKEMDCLHRADNCESVFFCEDTCPAFREPRKERIPGSREVGLARTTENIELQLCSEVGTLIFSEFEDERVSREADKEGDGC